MCATESHHHHHRQQQQQEVAVEDQNPFDRIPDDVLLYIFNKIHDARSLTRCLSVSKRFSSLIPLTPTVSLSFPQFSDHCSLCSFPDPRRPTRKSLIASAFDRLVRRPLRFFRCLVSPKFASASNENDGGDDNEECFRTPDQALKVFREIDSLRLELPCGVEAGARSGKATILKWTAQFGAGIKSCVVFGANSMERRPDSTAGEEESGELGLPIIEPTITEEELKLRVVWIISCLIAASARHYLLTQIAADHATLKDVVITDAGRQGKVKMRGEELAELRASSAKSSASASERSRVPDLKMKLWYAPELRLLESGRVVRGATVVLITPAEDNDVGFDELMKRASFDGGDGDEEAAIGEAVRAMRKMKRSYMLEMNSF